MNAKTEEMLARFGGTLKTTPQRVLLSTFIGGFAMWVIGGLWHNLILPIFNRNAQAHHEGLVIVLISYFVLAFLMAYSFSLTYQTGKSVVVEGLKMGVFIGIVWVFPHGLAMAGTHDTSIASEFQNTLYHLVEQGIGGLMVALLMVKPNK